MPREQKLSRANDSKFPEIILDNYCISQGGSLYILPLMYMYIFGHLVLR
jgi:hypothetical protein